MLPKYSGIGWYRFADGITVSSFLDIMPIKVLNVKETVMWAYGQDYLIHWELESGHLLEFDYWSARNWIKHYIEQPIHHIGENGYPVYFDSETMARLRWLQSTLEDTVANFRAGVFNSYSVQKEQLQQIEWVDVRWKLIEKEFFELKKAENLHGNRKAFFKHIREKYTWENGKLITDSHLEKAIQEAQIQHDEIRWKKIKKIKIKK